MTLVDTSAWIEFFRARGDPEIKKRVALLIDSGNAAYTCPIYFELLLGARPNEEGDVNAVLAQSKRVYFVSRHWALAVTLGRKLRRAGITVPSNDLFVAAVSVSEQMSVLCKDEHFPLMSQVLGNRLRLEEPDL